jgi:hypothetical protein
MTDHYSLSVDHVTVVHEVRSDLQDLFRVPPEVRDAREVARLSHQLGDSLKLADIHATLAVAQGLTDIYHAIVGSKLS